VIRSDLPIAKGAAARAPSPHEPQVGPAHDHDQTGLGAPVMEPSKATRDSIEARRRTQLRFWLLLALLSAAFVPYVFLQTMPGDDRVVLAAAMSSAALLCALFGYLQYCRVNLLTLYEKGIAPPMKPHLTFDRSMEFHVPFTEFTRVEVEDNDIDRKEMAEQIYYRFVFHYKDGARLVLTPAILGREPSKEQMTAFFGALKEALGGSIPDRVELRKVFPDGRRPVVAVSSRSLRLRVGAELREFSWAQVKKLKIRPAKLGSGGSFDQFDLLIGDRWLALDARRIPELKKADLLTFIEEILRVARSLKIEILQE
jgi:hypothetical protein